MGAVRGGQEMSSGAVLHILAELSAVRRNSRDSTMDAPADLLPDVQWSCAEYGQEFGVSECVSANTSQVRPVRKYYRYM
jgi:hypothetical protein